MADTQAMLEREFTCAHCGQQGGSAQKLALSGTGLSRLFEVQPYRYTFVSCTNCGYTEVFNLNVLEGKDNLGTFLEVLFAN
jgi:predicted nucleic-acid-binding Zn-ribbon protein